MGYGTLLAFYISMIDDQKVNQIGADVDRNVEKKRPCAGNDCSCDLFIGIVEPNYKYMSFLDSCIGGKNIGLVTSLKTSCGGGRERRDILKKVRGKGRWKQRVALV